MARSDHTPTRRAATLADFLAIPATARFHEILDGELRSKAMPSVKHAHAQRKLGALLDPYAEKAGRDAESSFWIVTEAEILLPGRQPVRPDIAAWRRARMPELPDSFAVELLPDWVCEVVSKEDPHRDTVIKRRDYARAGIPYYWLLDLRTESATALTLAAGDYVVAGEAQRGGELRAEPFSQLAIAVDALFGR